MRTPLARPPSLLPAVLGMLGLALFQGCQGGPAGPRDGGGDAVHSTPDGAPESLDGLLPADGFAPMDALPADASDASDARASTDDGAADTGAVDAEASDAPSEDPDVSGPDAVASDAVDLDAAGADAVALDVAPEDAAHSDAPTPDGARPTLGPPAHRPASCRSPRRGPTSAHHSRRPRSIRRQTS